MCNVVTNVFKTTVFMFSNIYALNKYVHLNQLNYKTIHVAVKRSEKELRTISRFRRVLKLYMCKTFRFLELD